MIQVQVTNLNTNQIGWSALFPDSSTANAWIAQGQAGNWWGKPLRQISSLDVAIYGENISSATSSQSETDPTSGEAYTLYTFAAEYSVASSDVSAQIALQAAIAKGLECQTFGATVIAQVYAYNESNLASGALTPSQFNAMLADTTIGNIERLLSNGSLSTALTLINGYTSTLETYFSSAQVAAIVAAINGSGLI